MQSLLQLKTQCLEFLQLAKSEIGKKTANSKIVKLDQMIAERSAERNTIVIKKQIGNLQTLSGSFSQNGIEV